MNFKEYLNEASKQFIVVPAKGAGGYTSPLDAEVVSFKSLNKVIDFMNKTNRTYYDLFIQMDKPFSDEELKNGDYKGYAQFLGKIVKLDVDEFKIYPSRGEAPVVLDDKIKRQLNAGKRFTRG